MTKWFNAGFRKVGGIYFWNVGRIGGSFYVSSRSAFARKQHAIAARNLEEAFVRAIELDFA